MLKQSWYQPWSLFFHTKTLPLLKNCIVTQSKVKRKDTNEELFIFSSPSNSFNSSKIEDIYFLQLALLLESIDQHHSRAPSSIISKIDDFLPSKTLVGDSFSLIRLLLPKLDSERVSTLRSELNIEKLVRNVFLPRSQIWRQNCGYDSIDDLVSDICSSKTIDHPKVISFAHIAYAQDKVKSSSNSSLNLTLKDINELLDLFVSSTNCPNWNLLTSLFEAFDPFLLKWFLRICLLKTLPFNIESTAILAAIDERLPPLITSYSKFGYFNPLALACHDLISIPYSHKDPHSLISFQKVPQSFKNIKTSLQQNHNGRDFNRLKPFSHIQKRTLSDIWRDCCSKSYFVHQLPQLENSEPHLIRFIVGIELRKVERAEEKQNTSSSSSSFYFQFSKVGSDSESLSSSFFHYYSQAEDSIQRILSSALPISCFREGCISFLDVISLGPNSCLIYDILCLNDDWIAYKLPLKDRLVSVLSAFIPPHHIQDIGIGVADDKKDKLISIVHSSLTSIWSFPSLSSHSISSFYQGLGKQLGMGVQETRTSDSGPILFRPVDSIYPSFIHSRSARSRLAWSNWFIYWRAENQALGLDSIDLCLVGIVSHEKRIQQLVFASLINRNEVIAQSELPRFKIVCSPHYLDSEQELEFDLSDSWLYTLCPVLSPSHLPIWLSHDLDNPFISLPNFVVPNLAHLPVFRLFFKQNQQISTFSHSPEHFKTTTSNYIHIPSPSSFQYLSNSHFLSTTTFNSLLFLSTN